MRRIEKEKRKPLAPRVNFEKYSLLLLICYDQLHTLFGHLNKCNCPWNFEKNLIFVRLDSADCGLRIRIVITAQISHVYLIFSQEYKIQRGPKR